jgi:hypothetical protein
VTLLPACLAAGLSAAADVVGGAPALASCGFDKAVDFAVAAFDVAAELVFRLCSLCPDLICGLCPHRGEELLGRFTRCIELLLTPLRTLRGKALGVALSVCHHPPRLLFCLAKNAGRCGLQAGLVDCRRGFVTRRRAHPPGFLARLRQGCLPLPSRPSHNLAGLAAGVGEQRIGLLACACERFLGLLARCVGRCLSLSTEPIGCLSGSLGSQSSTFHRRLGLQPAALDDALRLRLLLRHGTLTRQQLLLELARLRGRAAAAKPLAHELQVAVNLSGVIAPAYESEVTLDDERRASLPFSARMHIAAFAVAPPSPSAVRLAADRRDALSWLESERFVKAKRVVAGIGSDHEPFSAVLLC